MSQFYSMQYSLVFPLSLLESCKQDYFRLNNFDSFLFPQTGSLTKKVLTVAFQMSLPKGEGFWIYLSSLKALFWQVSSLQPFQECTYPHRLVQLVFTTEWDCLNGRLMI